MAGSFPKPKVARLVNSRPPPHFTSQPEGERTGSRAAIYAKSQRMHEIQAGMSSECCRCTREHDEVASGIFTVAAALLFTNAVLAQTAAPPPSAASGPFTLLRPGDLSLTLFGGGYISSDYGVTEEGLQVEQSITPVIGLVGRATGYQLYIKDNFDNPLNPGRGHHSRFNFGRLQGGAGFSYRRELISFNPRRR